MANRHPTTRRHAELVSASILQQVPSFQVEEWTLKQVQGDGGFVDRPTEIESRA
jgi:hypothetical protein